MTPCGRLLPDGLCASCKEGRHEIMPRYIRPSLEEHIAITESYLKQLREVLVMRAAEDYDKT